MEDSGMDATLDLSVPHLDTALAELTAEHPDREWRLVKAANIVAVRTVERSPSGPGWWVESESEAGKFYFVLPVDGRDTCNCQDYQQRGGPCKHALAAALFQRCERLDAEQSDPTQQPIGYALTPRGLAASTHPLTECAACDHDAVYHDGASGACTRQGVDAEGLYFCDCAAFTLGDDAA